MKPLLSVVAITLIAAAAAAAQCRVTIQETKKAVPWAANTGEIQWTSNQPADCKVEKSVPWVSVSILPPTTGSAGILRYSIDTNLAPAERAAKVQVGDSAVEISQAAGPKPGMAFSPGRIELQFSPSPNAPKEITKSLFVGSDQPLAFSARLAEPAEWVKVQSGSQGPRKQQTFTVTVKTDQLKPGANQANIQIEADGAANPKETIPVIVRVAGPEAAAK